MFKAIAIVGLLILFLRAIKKGIHKKAWFDARGKAVERKEFSFGDFLLALFLLDLLFSKPDQPINDDWEEDEDDDGLDIFEPCSIFDMDCDAIPDMFESDEI